MAKLQQLWSYLLVVWFTWAIAALLNISTVELLHQWSLTWCGDFIRGLWTFLPRLHVCSDFIRGNKTSTSSLYFVETSFGPNLFRNHVMVILLFLFNGLKRIIYPPSNNRNYMFVGLKWPYPVTCFKLHKLIVMCIKLLLKLFLYWLKFNSTFPFRNTNCKYRSTSLVLFSCAYNLFWSQSADLYLAAHVSFFYKTVLW